MSSENAAQKHQLPVEQEAESEPAAPLTRTSSLYSLTLGEIKHTVCEPGKPFGSMNMEEFLTNIWNAEEGQVSETMAPKAAENVVQPVLRRQASLLLPGSLGRKTVDEVWAQIHYSNSNAPTGSYQMPQQPVHSNCNSETTGEPAPFGEMTLEEFLVKAGVVREGRNASAAVMPSAPQTLAQVMPATPQYNMAGCQIPTAIPEGFGHFAVSGGYSDGYGMGNGYGSSMDNGNGQMVSAGSPSSPGSPEEIEAKPASYRKKDEAFGIAKCARKREADENGVEKGVERRQRRMIKNRESAARSRARKQAYTVELEAELKQLKETNAKLQEEQMKMKKKLLVDTMEERSQTYLEGRVGELRRCSTAHW